MPFTLFDNIVKCRICRRVFQYPGFGPKLCPACKSRDDAAFRKVKDFLYDNPGSTLIQTADACNVEPERIRLWLRDERLEYTMEGDTGLICDRCGKPVRSGKLCPECRSAYSKAAGEMKKTTYKPETHQTKTPDKNRMRFLGNRTQE